MNIRRFKMRPSIILMATCGTIAGLGALQIGRYANSFTLGSGVWEIAFAIIVAIAITCERD